VPRERGCGCQEPREIYLRLVPFINGTESLSRHSDYGRGKRREGSAGDMVEPRLCGRWRRVKLGLEFGRRAVICSDREDYGGDSGNSGGRRCGEVVMVLPLWMVSGVGRAEKKEEQERQQRTGTKLRRTESEAVTEVCR
jgi:hypothetical protein